MRPDLVLSPDLAMRALSSAADSILETMFFTAADATDPPGEWPRSIITAQLDYCGRFSGRFQLELEMNCATELASNVMGGVPEGTLAACQAGHLACELANMLCGNALNRLEPTVQFNLTAPRIVEPGAAWTCPVGKPCCAVRWLQTESGLLRLCLEWKR
jgi:CheY-specific phosphatase CheX